MCLVFTLSLDIEHIFDIVVSRVTKQISITHIHKHSYTQVIIQLAAVGGIFCLRKQYFDTISFARKCFGKIDSNIFDLTFFQRYTLSPFYSFACSSRCIFKRNLFWGRLCLCEENENLFEMAVELWHDNNVRPDKATNELYDNTTNIPFTFQQYSIMPSELPEPEYKMT